MDRVLDWPGWAMASLMVAVVFGVAATVVARRYGTRRVRLLYRVEVTPLISVGRSHDLLQVTYDGAAVAEPWLVTVDLRNAGPRDVASASFDQLKPLTVTLGARVVAVLEDDQVWATDLSSPNVVLLPPCHLAKGQRLSLQCIVDGKPSVEIGRLIDADVVPASVYRETFKQVLLDSLPQYLAATAGVAGVTGLIAVLLS